MFSNNSPSIIVNRPARHKAEPDSAPPSLRVFEVDQPLGHSVRWNRVIDHDKRGPEATPITTERPRPSEYARRFDTNKKIKEARKNGIPYDPVLVNGIPTTSTDIEPVGPDTIRSLTGARAADSYIDIDITGKKTQRRRTKAGAPEIVIQEDILPDDIVGYGKVKKSGLSSET